MFFCTNTICAVGQNLIDIINGVLVPVLFAISFIVFLYGIAQAYIFSGGDSEKVGKGHKLLMWGIIGFVVMVSLWGMVNVVANTFGLSGAYAPLTPSSVPFGGFGSGTGSGSGSGSGSGAGSGSGSGSGSGTSGIIGAVCATDADCNVPLVCKLTGTGRFCDHF